MCNEKDIIAGCLRKEPRAQQELYKAFAPKMYGVCLRYAKNEMEADDILQEGFIKVFGYLESYRNEGSLEGWIRRTMVNTAINYYRKNLKHANQLDLSGLEIVNDNDISVVDKLSADEIIGLIQDLPEVYRVTFNMYVIEGYTHKKIAEILDISENTSKSQLLRARKLLKKRLSKLHQAIL
ncbi:MAG: sigma-70 family RNA polymerase sigma factor [Bacteroidales bacterium]|nr:sigma-70 family RNA polymerase sigma factor [Bacteroidales bacterium]